MGSGEGSTSEELHSLYRSPNIVRLNKARRLRWASYVAIIEEGRGTFKILTGKPTGKRPLERSRRRWYENIRMDLKEIGVNARNLVNLLITHDVISRHAVQNVVARTSNHVIL